MVGEDWKHGAFADKKVDARSKGPVKFIGSRPGKFDILKSLWKNLINSEIGILLKFGSKPLNFKGYLQ